MICAKPETFALSELEEHLGPVLDNLAACPRQHRPFVILMDSVTGRFVQFATCRSCQEIIFDVPGKREFPETKNPTEWSVTRHSMSRAELVTWSRNTLTGPLRLPPEARLRVAFDTSFPGKDG